MKIRFSFIDSFRFLPCSLDKLANYLPNSKKVILRSMCATEEEFLLLTRKGSFPYDYLTSFDVFDNTIALPEKQEFYNKLNETNISDEDYSHAQRVWHTFNIKNLGEYCDLYMRTDIVLLCDIFQNFRDLCMKTYHLEAAAYFSLPGLTFDAMLRYTGVRLQIINDPEILFFLERGVRGGIVQASMKHAKANNPYMKDKFNPKKDTSYILYLDANNLYGWSMNQPLPTGEFEFLENPQDYRVEDLDIFGEYGYIFECDIEYPEKIHDYLNDYPPLPEKTTPPGSKYQKLLLTLCKKERYVVHFRALKQAVELGVTYKTLRI